MQSGRDPLRQLGLRRVQIGLGSTIPFCNTLIQVYTLSSSGVHPSVLLTGHDLASHGPWAGISGDSSYVNIYIFARYKSLKIYAMLLKFLNIYLHAAHESKI